jgi:hypothetical protein
MQYNQYFAIENKLKKKGFKGDRHDLILLFTEERKSGLSELTPTEYLHFIIWLNRSFDNLLNQKYLDDQCDRMRKKVIALFHKMDYQLPSGKIDMQQVNAWCVKYGHKHTILNNYSYEELTKLVTQAESYLKTFIKAL